MEIQYSQLKINHLKDTPSTKVARGGIYSGVLLKDIKVPVKARRTLSSVGTSSSNLVAPTPAPKLTLNDKLCKAFCSQAGLSAVAVDCIWEDAQGNE